MPEIKITVSTDGAKEAREALANHQKVDLVTNAEVRSWLIRQLDSLILHYRESKSREANPVDRTSIAT